MPLTLLSLPTDALARIIALTAGADVPALRAAFRAARELLPPKAVPRSAMLRSPALAAWAWDLPGFRSAKFDEPAQRRLCTMAARTGSVGTLKWLREHGCAWDYRTCEAAADSGDLAMLQWAREHGCGWLSGTVYAAAAGGHLAVLQYARQHGCPWSGFTYIVAAAGGHLAVLQWAHENGCESTCRLKEWPNFDQCVEKAEKNGHAHVVAWLQSL